MLEQSGAGIYISVDIKKYRIRIYKSVLHLLGNPAYIQLLVNPADRLVAIKSVPDDAPGNHAHKVSRMVMESDHSVEIYSQTFIMKMLEAADMENICGIWRMTGAFIPAENMVLFPMSTMKKTQPEEQCSE